MAVTKGFPCPQCRHILNHYIYPDAWSVDAKGRVNATTVQLCPNCEFCNEES